MTRVIKCSECKNTTLEPVFLPGSTWYFIFDHDSSQIKMQEGWGWPIKWTTREVWELSRAKRDKYSPVYGKIFKCNFVYCKVCVPGNPKR